MAFENFKLKYIFNQGKEGIKISKTYILKAIWTIIHHKKEEKRFFFSKFGPVGLEPMHVPDKGLPC